MQTLKECGEGVKGGLGCWWGKIVSMTDSGVCMEAVQGVSLACAKAYFL